MPDERSPLDVDFDFPGDRRRVRAVRAAVKVPLVLLGGIVSLANIETAMAEGFDEETRRRREGLELLKADLDLFPAGSTNHREKTEELETIKVYANSHYVTPKPTLHQAAAVTETCSGKADHETDSTRRRLACGSVRLAKGS